MKEVPLLQVSGLKKYFPIVSGFFRRQVGEIRAVDGIDFTLHQGEVLGVVGESGSGKSTAARAAIRLFEPTAGQVMFDGVDFLALSPEELKSRRKEIQMVFQDPYASLNPRKSVGESIGEALTYHGMVTSPSEQEERVAETLVKVGLSPDVMHKYPHQFSGGQQQRICIGRAIVLGPKVIICDEAVSALDVSVQAQILNLLEELKASMGLSYLFISHDLAVIRHLSDRVVVMCEGKVVEEGPVETLFEDPQHSYTQKLLSAIPITHPKYR